MKQVFHQNFRRLFRSRYRARRKSYYGKSTWSIQDQRIFLMTFSSREWVSFDDEDWELDATGLTGWRESYLSWLRSTARYQRRGLRWANMGGRRVSRSNWRRHA